MRNELIGIENRDGERRFVAFTEDIDPAGLAPGELLVAVRAVSVNPVDTKLAAGVEAGAARPTVLGFDAAGEVVAAGDGVQDFRPGDAVYYAGVLKRDGTFARYHRIDARLVARKPATLDFAQAAAFPLVGITAWESLFDHLGVRAPADAGRRLLVINGAGGVGSVAIQLGRLAGLAVIATAGRDESRAWCEALGARVVDRRRPLREQLDDEVDCILCAHDTNTWFDTMAECIAPRGRIVALVSASAPLDMNRLKNKSAAFCWEFMFTRSLYDTGERAAIGRLLTDLARWIDAGLIRPIDHERLQGLTPDNLQRAFDRVAAGELIGKLVLTVD